MTRGPKVQIGKYDLRLQLPTPQTSTQTELVNKLREIKKFKHGVPASVRQLQELERWYECWLAVQQKALPDDY